MSEDKKSRKEWVHQLDLNAYFEDALAKYRARTGYGVTFALYNSLNEFWHQTRDMTEEGYLYNQKKYSETLIEAKKRIEASKALTREQSTEDQKLKDKEIEFKNLVEQWKERPGLEWRLKIVKYAEKWKDKVPSAKLLLDLANKDVISNE